MTHSIERKDGDLIVRVDLDGDELARLQNRVIDDMCKEVTVKGFRKGKAPRELAIRHLSSAEVSDRLARRVIDKAYRHAVRSADVLLALEGEVAERAVPSVEITPELNRASFFYPLLPAVSKLGGYTGIKTEVTLSEVTDESVQKELERIADEESDLTPTDDPIEEGFTANCDIKGSINGVSKPELSEKAYDVNVGTGLFIPGIDPHFIGKRIGDTFGADITLPDNYPSDVAGKLCHFEIKINSVKRKVVPAIDDELATLQTEYADCENLEALKAKIKEKLTTVARNRYETSKLNAILTACGKESEFTFDEKRLKEALVSAQKEDDRQQLEAYGVELADYLKMVGIDEATYETNVFNNRMSSLRGSALESAIAEKENFAEVSEEELSKAAEENGIDLDQVRQRSIEDISRACPGATEEDGRKLADIRLAGLKQYVVAQKLRGFLLDNND